MLMLIAFLTASNAVSTPRWGGIQPGVCSNISVGTSDAGPLQLNTYDL